LIDELAIRHTADMELRTQGLQFIEKAPGLIIKRDDLMALR
jgi:hypothetical protein